jgi:hypothetical protein
VSFIVGFGGHQQASQSQQEAATNSLTTAHASGHADDRPDYCAEDHRQVQGRRHHSGIDPAPGHQRAAVSAAASEPVLGCTPTHSGSAASDADVNAALVSAASTQYWSGVQSTRTCGRVERRVRQWAPATVDIRLVARHRGM